MPQRAGPGRPKGIPNKRTLALQQLAAAAGVAPGELPHEFLLRVSRGERIEHGTVSQGRGKNKKEVPAFIQPTFEHRLEAARQAAPFYAPRLSNVEVMRTLTNEQLDAVIAGLAPQAGVSISVSGAGAQVAIGITDQPATPGSVQRPRLLISSATGQPVS